MTAREQQDLEDEAAFWVVRMHSDQVTSEDERLFSAWLGKDLAHGEAYDRQNKLWRSVAALRHDSDAMDAFAELRETARRPHRPSRRGLIAASLGGGVAIAGGWMAWDAAFGAKAYATEVGEQQRVVLDDGSTVTLNTDSALRVRFSRSERKLWLDKGQAYFSVAKDPGRPFRIFVGDEELRCTGSAFDVRRDGDKARVTLEEGSVEVYREGEPGALDVNEPAVVLRPGQRLVVTRVAPVEISAVDTRSVGAWRFGRMVFDSEPLGDAIAEINRYNTRQIVISDPSLAEVAINGVFQTGKPEAFVEALTAAFPVRVRSQDAEAIYLERRTPSQG